MASNSTVTLGPPECSIAGLWAFVPTSVMSIIPWIIMLRCVPAKRGIAWRERALYYASTSPIGIGIEMVSAILSVFSCVLYIATTYVGDIVPMWMQGTEVAFSTSFMIYWGMNLFLSRWRLKYILTLQSLLDLGTSLPTLIAVATGLCGDGSVSGILAVARILKFLRVFRLMRVVRSMELISDRADDAIHRQTMKLVSTVVVIMVVSTGFVQFLANDLDEEWLGVKQLCRFKTKEGCEAICTELQYCALAQIDPLDGTTYFPCTLRYIYRGDDATCKNQMHFHDSLYFTIATFGTVGYGDVAPVDSISRISIILLIAIAIYAVPMQVNKLSQLRELRSEFDGVFRKGAGRPHAILSCSPDLNVSKFIAEFFHEDHQNLYTTTPQLVLLLDRLPDADMRKLLLQYTAKQRLVFIRGDAANPKDLSRARCDTADVVFLLTNIAAVDQNKEDEIAVLRALMVRRVNPTVRVYSQLLQPENEHHMVNTGVRRMNIMCQNQMRLSLLGFGAVCPGLPTLLINMTRSISWRQSFGMSTWQEEYCQGMVMEMYHFRPRSELVGSRFGSFVSIIKEEANGILFAIAKTEDNKPSAGGKARLPDVATASHDKPAEGDGAQASRKGKTTSRFSATFGRKSTKGWDEADEEREEDKNMIGVMFNPGPDYVVQEGDVMFVVADSAARLQPFERICIQSRDWVKDLFPSFSTMRHQSEVSKLLSDRSSELPPVETAPDSYPPRKGSALGEGGITSLLRATSRRWGSATTLESNISGEFAENAVAAQGEQRSMSEELAYYKEAASPTRKEAGPEVWKCLRTQVRQHNQHLDDSRKQVSGNVDALLRAIGNSYGLDQQAQASTTVRQYMENNVLHISNMAKSFVHSGRPALRTLDSVLIRTVPEHMRDHIVVVSSTLDDMTYFLGPVHARNRPEDTTAVVFVLDKLPSPREWQEAGVFPNVYVMLHGNEGGHYTRELLMRAGASRASSVVFACDTARLRVSAEAADSMVLCNLLEGLYVTAEAPKVRLISELTQGGCSRKVVKALMKGRKVGEIDVEERIQSYNLMEGMQHLENDFVAGNSVSTDLLFLLVCQQFFNPYILAIFQQILLGHQTDRENGKVESVQHGETRDSVILYRPLPSGYEGKPFRDLFNDLLRSEGSIVLGLYRKAVPDSSGYSQRYVYTNPNREAILRKSDRLYVIPRLPAKSRRAASFRRAPHPPASSAPLRAGSRPVMRGEMAASDRKEESGQDRQHDEARHGSLHETSQSLGARRDAGRDSKGLVEGGGQMEGEVRDYLAVETAEKDRIDLPGAVN